MYIVISGFLFVAVSFLLMDWHLGRLKWRVKYPPDAWHNFKGGYSVRMSWWVAKDYAKIFGGEVVRADEYVSSPKGDN